MKRLLSLLAPALLAGLVLGVATVPAPAATVGPPEISWSMVGLDVVRFHLRFSNPDPVEPTQSVSGAMFSQEFGVFLPDYGPIGSFNVPPMAPSSFFDVFFDVPLSQLPINPGQSMVSDRTQAMDVPCPPPMWVGNVDVFWSGPGGGGQVNYHSGDFGVCPGGPASCLHVVTGCVNNLTWAINNPCPPGWTVTLENQDHTPAPALLPPNWMGWVCITAGPGIPVGAQCCPTVDFFCNGVKATINICAFACLCPTPTESRSWGEVKAIYR
jgi:hypothetical protein